MKISVSTNESDSLLDGARRARMQARAAAEWRRRRLRERAAEAERIARGDERGSA